MKDNPYHVLVGFWRVDGVEYSNETKLSGNGRTDKSLLLADIREQHPRAKEVLPLGTKIEIRTNATSVIELAPGAVLRNIFVDVEGKDDPVKNVGQVWFDGAPYEVLMLYSRANGCVLVNLKPRVANYGMVRFSNQLNPQRSLSELPNLIKEVLGTNARELQLNVREKIKAQ